jgi:hypothetical protein
MNSNAEPQPQSANLQTFATPQATVPFRVAPVARMTAAEQPDPAHIGHTAAEIARPTQKTAGRR